MNTAQALQHAEFRDVRAFCPATGLWLHENGTGFTQPCKWHSTKLTGHQITVVGTTWENVRFEDATNGDCYCDDCSGDD